ncbi:hypothetical protein BLA29_011083, partial [Euroglyphus maynei]
MNNVKSNPSLLDKYIELKQMEDQVQALYIWIDGQQNIRAKTKTLNFIPKLVSELPIWTTDGHSNYITETNVEIYLSPIRMYNDPFRGGNNKLILCEILYEDFTIPPLNTRHTCNVVMDMAANQEP